MGIMGWFCYNSCTAISDPITGVYRCNIRYIKWHGCTYIASASYTTFDQRVPYISQVNNKQWLLTLPHAWPLQAQVNQ